MTRPTEPLPPPHDRAAAVDVSERWSIPLSTIYGLMNSGDLPSWRVGRKKRVTSWTSARRFFGDREPPVLES